MVETRVQAKSTQKERYINKVVTSIQQQRGHICSGVPLFKFQHQSPASETKGIMTMIDEES